MDDDLEDELKRLFEDERLDVRVSPDAERTVVAGARRVRRRRTAFVTAAAVVSAGVLAASTVFAVREQGTAKLAEPPTLAITSSSTTVSTSEQAAQGTSVAQPPSTETTKLNTSTPPSGKKETTSSSTSPRTSVPPTIITNKVLGPVGYGPFRLGMSEAELLATQLAEPAGDVGGCAKYEIKGIAGSALYYSPSYGLGLIVLTSNVRTPAGITIGSTEDQVRNKYPDYNDTVVSHPRAAVPGNSTAVYEFTYSADEQRTVTGLTLMGTQDCAG
jgi:hypothetical protein